VDYSQASDPCQASDPFQKLLVILSAAKDPQLRRWQRKADPSAAPQDDIDRSKRVNRVWMRH